MFNEEEKDSKTKISYNNAEDMIADLNKSWEDKRKGIGGLWFRFDCWISNIWSNIRYSPKQIKYFFQRMFRGFGDDILWDVFSNESERMAKILIKFKEKTWGYPNGMSEEEWDSKIDDMIFFHQNVDSEISKL